MKLITGLFRFARKRVQTKDNDMGMFRDKLTELVEKKDTLSDEEITSKVEELKSMTADLPEADDKEKLDRFLEDFKSVKEQDGSTAKEAASMVSDLFEKLDTEAMKDVPAVEEETSETEETELADGEPDSLGEYAKQNVKEDIDHITQTKDGDEEEETETAEEAVEETVAPDSEVKDSENSDYTLEEIYQFIKKRMAEDSAACDGADEVEEEETEEEEDEEVVTDHAPRIPVTIGNNAAEGSLAGMFAKIKEGGR